ncbi:hypothetical protein FA13DRAFT_1784850 [Coprinellus micaceus]|uniref:C2H2-type domain-containing protein n=1 Tax=Coprinellus micaceus TaxID=71717 RepID=A0A4Y7U201_COPMI|nr:hypothetical protein FA13DRAFT_1784850 [Coprinellus micaceus]
MPSLPQTKFCSLCPAKFTRTTHLNRHLRSHTNERSHKCEVCSAEFTRSDLLTRHKRTCGDYVTLIAHDGSLARQACAESKVKCDLQLPCSKCIARGRECTFINDPEMSRSRRASRRGRSVSESPQSAEGSGFGSTSAQAETQTSSVPSPPTTPYSIIYPSPVSLVSSLPDSMQSSPASSHPMEIGVPFGVPGLSHSHSSSSSSTSSRSLRDEPFDMSNIVEFNFDSLDIDCQFNDFFPLPSQPEDTAFSFADLISPTSCSSEHPPPSTSFTSGSDSGSIFGGFQSDSGFSYNPHPPGPAATTPCFRASWAHLIPVPPGPMFDSSVSGLTSNTETEDLGVYRLIGWPRAALVNTFFTMFSTHIPLIHRPTWTMEDKHPMLVSAMQACGAIFLKTQVSLAFVQRTLDHLGDSLIAEFSKPNATLKDRFSLIMAVVLLQSWNLLSRQPDRMGTSRLFHGVVVTMIRRIGLIRLLSTWTPPDLSNHYTLDTAWREWARFETLKRVVFFAYIQDCSNCAYFSTMPIFHPSEIEISLPCDDNLWAAQNVREWYQMLQTPSPYAAPRDAAAHQPLLPPGSHPHHPSQHLRLWLRGHLLRRSPTLCRFGPYFSFHPSLGSGRGDSAEQEPLQPVCVTQLVTDVEEQP